MVIQSANVAPTNADVPDAAERGYRRVAALAELDLHASSLAEVLARIAEVTTELLPADLGASVVLWEARSERFTTASTTVPGGAIPLEELRHAGGVTRLVIDERQTVAVADVADNPVEINPVTEARGIRAYVATPIVADDRALGVLFAMSGSPRSWAAADLAFLETVSLRAASAIEAARLADEANWARERAEALSQVANALMGVSSLTEVLQTIAESVAAAIGADHVRLSVEGLGPRQETALVTAGLVSESSFCGSCRDLLAYAMERAEDAEYTISIATKEIEAQGNTDAGALMVAPLRYRGRRIGFLTAIRRAGNPPFEPDDAALMTGMATQAVVAIDNASLMEDTQEALAELSALFEIVQVQNSGADLDAMLHAMAGVVASALPAWEVALACLEPGSHHVERVVTGGRGDLAVDLAAVNAELEVLFQAEYREPRLERNDDRERLVIPLLNRNEPIGILIAENPAGTVDFVENAPELASVMGSQITVAIANALLFEETQRLATTDALTGLSNRRSLFQLAERSFAAAIRYGRPLTAIMFDIDHFKRVNDTFGHGVGDEVLREIARRCESGVREVDILGRYGGEEFLAILPETARDGARGVAERLRTAVGDSPIPTTAGPIPVTVSAGVAALDEECASLHDLLQRADGALYEAKRRGRNRVHAI